MEFPTHKFNQSISGQGFLDGTYQFYSIVNTVEENSVSKHDYAFCGVWSGSALFAYIPQKER